ncbi:TonB-dependent receptor [Sphingomonas sp. DC1100-1]|uniref:TonB-dependent receptor n=3 Tax=Bacteria TaxID=2 RepID=UPI003CF3A4B8
MSMVLRARRARLLCCASVMLVGAATPALASGPALPADPLPADMASRDAAGPDPQTDIVVQANRQATAQKEQSPAVVDTIVYDDVETIAADGNIAEQLRLLPGISTIDEGDAPRFVTIRGIAPDLNQTTIDGITLASIGNDGEGSRMINLQIIPSELSQRTDVYKTFTAEQDGGAIGGIVDIVTRSPLDLKRRYTMLDGYGSYQSFRGPDGRNTIGGSAQHWGGGAKGVFADRFGSHGQFGILLSARYQSRTRNSAKWWQPVKNYFDAGGKLLAGPDAGNWDGRAVPGDHSYGSYTNRLRTAGSSGKLEWQASDRIRASLLGFGYRLWESSTMNKNDYYTRSTIVARTATGGRSQVNSIYSRYRYDTWDKKTFGGIASLGWRGDASHLDVRGGYTRALYDNVQPYVGVRTYPAKLFLDWEDGSDATGGIPRVTGISDPNAPFASIYKLSTANITERSAREGLTDVRVDYAWNTEASDRGFGLATGVEFRRLDLSRDLDVNTYRLGRVMTDYLVDPNYRPVGSAMSFPWIDYTRAKGSLWQQIGLDARATAYQAAASDYRYVERLWTPYLSLHHASDTTRLVAGVRYDHIGFDAHQPVIRSGVVLPGQTVRRGGYAYLLPSFAADHDLGDGTKLRFAYSRTLGRPTPGDIAQPETISCGVEDEEAGGPDCSIRRGNPNLRPRRADNLDVGAEYYFGTHGVIAVAAFAKWIKDDIYVLRSLQEVDGTTYAVREPTNAERSRLYGIEFQVAEHNVDVLGRKVDPFFNVTLLDGQMHVTGEETGTRTVDRLMYQPRVTLGAGATVRLPEIAGAIRGTVSHRSASLTALGVTPKDDTGRAPLTVVNAALWHRVLPHVTFKYEINNLFNDQPKFLAGNRLQYVNEIDDYGRAAFFHIVLN